MYQSIPTAFDSSSAPHMGGHLTQDSPPWRAFDHLQNVVQGLKTKESRNLRCVHLQGVILKQLHRHGVVLQRAIPMKVLLRCFECDGKV